MTLNWPLIVEWPWPSRSRSHSLPPYQLSFQSIKYFLRNTLSKYLVLLYRETPIDGLDLELTFEYRVTLTVKVFSHSLPPYQVSFQSTKYFVRNCRFRCICDIKMCDTKIYSNYSAFLALSLHETVWDIGMVCHSPDGKDKRDSLEPTVIFVQAIVVFVTFHTKMAISRLFLLKLAHI